MAPIPTSSPRPFIPAAGVAQLEAVYTYLGQRCENVYHFKKGSLTEPYTITDMDNLEAAFVEWETDHAVAERDAGCVLSLVRVRDLSEEAGLVREYSPTVGVTGLRSGGHLPGNVTIAVKWLTGRGGRSFRGRTYHIGFSDDRRDGNQITPDGRTALLSVYSNLLSNITDASGDSLSVVSYAHNKLWRETAVVTPVVSCSVDANLDSQRRRLTSRGQ